MPSGATKVRFLWALNLLKAYDTEGNLSGNVGERCDEKTFQYWAWYFIEILSERLVEVVSVVCVEIVCMCRRYFAVVFSTYVLTRSFSSFLRNTFLFFFSYATRYFFERFHLDRFRKSQDKWYRKRLSYFGRRYRFCPCLGCWSNTIKLLQI